MKREEKYLVMRTKDLPKYLSDGDVEHLARIADEIFKGRERDGKVPRKRYVIVSETLPFYEKVWEMIEEYVYGKEIQKRWAYLSYDEGKENLPEQLSILNAIHKFNHFVEAIYKSSSSPEKFDPQIRNSFLELQKKYPGCIKMRETF